MDKYKIMVKGIVLYNNKYLIVERWYDDRIVDPYQWEFVDGKVEFGESPDKAVIRLVQQNTGLSAEISKILYTWSFMMGDVCNLGISYLCLSASEEVILSEELNQYKWIERDEMEKYIDNKLTIQDIEKAELI